MAKTYVIKSKEELHAKKCLISPIMDILREQYNSNPNGFILRKELLEKLDEIIKDTSGAYYKKSSNKPGVVGETMVDIVLSILREGRLLFDSKLYRGEYRTTREALDYFYSTPRNLVVEEIYNNFYGECKDLVRNHERTAKVKVAIIKKDGRRIESLCPKALLEKRISCR